MVRNKRSCKILIKLSRHKSKLSVVADGEVQNQIAWSEHLDPLFVNNYEIDPTLSWQYYASSSGFMRRYPGKGKNLMKI